MKKATVRVCASCEWIFRDHASCPQCGFAHYGARWVYGPAAYRYEKTQEPWKNKKIEKYIHRLDDEIRKAQDQKGEKYETLISDEEV